MSLRKICFWRGKPKRESGISYLPKDLSENIHIRLVWELGNIREKALILYKPFEIPPVWNEICQSGYTRLIAPELLDNLKLVYTIIFPSYIHQLNVVTYGDVKGYLNKRLGIKYEGEGDIVTRGKRHLSTDAYNEIIHAIISSEPNILSEQYLSQLFGFSEEDAENLINNISEDLRGQNEFREIFDLQKRLIRQIDLLSDKLVALHTENLRYEQRIQDDMRNAQKQTAYTSRVMVLFTIGLLGAAIIQASGVLKQNEIIEKQTEILYLQTQIQNFTASPFLYIGLTEGCKKQIELDEFNATPIVRNWTNMHIGNSGYSTAVCNIELDSEIVDEMSWPRTSALIKPGAESDIKITYYTYPYSEHLKDIISMKLKYSCHSPLDSQDQKYSAYVCDYKLNHTTMTYVSLNLNPYHIKG